MNTKICAEWDIQDTGALSPVWEDHLLFISTYSHACLLYQVKSTKKGQITPRCYGMRQIRLLPCPVLPWLAFLPKRRLCMLVTLLLAANDLCSPIHAIPSPTQTLWSFFSHLSNLRLRSSTHRSHHSLPSRHHFHLLRPTLCSPSHRLEYPN